MSIKTITVPACTYGLTTEQFLTDPYSVPVRYLDDILVPVPGDFDSHGMRITTDYGEQIVIDDALVHDSEQIEDTFTVPVVKMTAYTYTGADVVCIFDATNGLYAVTDRDGLAELLGTYPDDVTAAIG